MAISRTISVEELIAAYPAAVTTLLRHKVPALVCGEPVWETLEETARASGKSDREIDDIVDELKRQCGRDHAS